MKTGIARKNGGNRLRCTGNFISVACAFFISSLIFPPVVPNSVLLASRLSTLSTEVPGVKDPLLYNQKKLSLLCSMYLYVCY